MSNLSELLPTGGGQNAVDFVASGTLSSGQTVALKADGTVEAVGETSETASLGTESVFTTNTPNEIKAAYDVASGKMVIAYVDATNPYYGTAVVGTISGDTISFGTPVVFQSAGSSEIAITYDSAAQKIVVVYYETNGFGIVGTVSGTSISFGTRVQFNSGQSQQNSLTYDSTNNKIIVAYRDGSNADRGTAIIGTVSGTTISFGSEYLFNPNGVSYPQVTYDSTNQKVVFVYKDDGNSARLSAIVGTVSGTSISFGAEQTTVNGTNYATAYGLVYATNGKVVCLYKDDTLNRLYSVVGTVSGTTISFGSQVLLGSGPSYISLGYHESRQVAVAMWKAGSNMVVSSGTVSGTTIAWSSTTIVETSNSEFSTVAYDSSGQQMLLAWAYYTSSWDGGANTFLPAYTATNVANFIGITAEAISDTATGAVNVYGGINEAQTGLTIGADYYVQDDGSISTTSSAVKIGQAISATTINMMDLT